MRLSRRAIDFNKEILMGEIGALIGAPLLGLIGSFIDHTPKFISSFTILGSVLGSTSFWFMTKVHDEKKYGYISRKDLAKKISLITPVAILISILIGYPMVFLVTYILSASDHVTLFSSIMGEVSGFCVFLGMINTYRYILVKKFNKEM